MKTLYLIRHAKAEDAEGGIADKDRHLTAKGKEDSHIMSQILAAKAHEKALIVSSSAARALQTARLFAKSLHILRESIIQNDAIYTAKNAIELLKVVENLDDATETALLIGHNPMLTAFLNELCGKHFPDMSTCAVAEITFEVSSWREVSFGTGNCQEIDCPKDHRAQVVV